MRVIYIAEDGTLFDNEWDCEHYEFRASLKGLKDIVCLDEDGEILYDLFSQDTYNYGNVISVLTDDALKTLHKIANYCGWCLWDDIDSIGTWSFKEDNRPFCEGKFIKVKEK